MTRSKPLALALALFLTACATVGETPAQRVFEQQGKMNALLSQVRDYVRQPTCTAIVVVACAKPSVVVHLREVSRDMVIAKDAARASLGSPGAETEVRAYASSVRALAAVLAAQQVRK